MAEIVTFNLNELNLESLDFTTDEKDRIILTLQGRALKNPVAPIGFSTRTEVNRLSTFFNEKADEIFALENNLTYNSNNPYFPIHSSKLRKYSKVLEEYSIQLSEFITHTNVVSGVDLTYTGFPPNFLGRVGIAQAYNRLKESLRPTAEEDCSEGQKEEIFSEMFYSIRGFGENSVTDTFNQINQSEIQIENITGASYAVKEELIDTLIDTVESSKTNLVDIAGRDDNGFYRAYNFVTNVSIAQSLLSIKDEDFTNNLIQKINGTELFKKDDISGLKLRCQEFDIPNNRPSGDFNTQFTIAYEETRQGGFIDYNDLTTSISPITVAADTWTDVTNDGQGQFSNDTYRPVNVTSFMNTTNGYIDISQLQLGDAILVRHDFTVTPNSNNGFAETRLQLGSGNSMYYLEKHLGRMNRGSGQEHRYHFTDYIYVGNEDTRNNFIKFQIKTSVQSEVTNVGTVIHLLRR